MSGDSFRAAKPKNPEAPLSAPITAFPGAVPWEAFWAIRSIHPRCELRWSPRFQCFEVWNETGGNFYPFYRHMTEDGEFMPADSRLISKVCERAMFTQHGQEVLNRRRQRAAQNNTSEGTRDADEVAWKAIKDPGLKYKIRSFPSWMRPSL